MRLLVRFIIGLCLALPLAFPASASEYVAMTAPHPPYSINKGLHVHGIAVDTLAVIMTLSGQPMTTDDVKLMLWNHAMKLTIKGPHRVMLNVPRTTELDPMFKWVGPFHVSKYVVIGRKNGKTLSSIQDLNNYKIGAVRDSLPEKALIASGVDKGAISSSVTHVIPLKKLNARMLDFFVHSDTSATYLMTSLNMKTDTFSVHHTYLEVPIYFAFSKDTDDGFIKKLNDNLEKMKQPGKDGKSRFDKIVAKYLPNGVLD